MRYPLNASVPNPPGAIGCPLPRTRTAASVRANALFCRMGGPPKPRPASAANMSKRGLSARLYAPNQTSNMVNAGLPKGNLAAAKGGRGVDRLLQNRTPNKQNRPSAYRRRAAFSPQVRWAMRPRLSLSDFERLMPGADHPRAAVSAGCGAAP